MLDFTPENLISYLYGETDEVTTARIKSALDSSWALREKLQVLKTSIDRLDTARLQAPSEASVSAILAYARKRSKVVP